MVTIAIITSMENSAGRMMPACRPMLRMMSSVRPRAFINAPRPSARALPCPAISAAAQQATNFAKMEAASTAAAISSSCGVFTIANCVLSPE